MRRTGPVTGLALLESVVARRAPDLASVVSRLGEVELTPDQRERIRRAVVDELCELPDSATDRRALELIEVLGHLGGDAP